MKCLLDTHIFLRLITADARLSASLKEVLQDPANELYVSGSR
jgi:PIN domain nuclease of toxin-antitoxin system